MLRVEEKVLYKAFGLSITSDIPLPELSQSRSNIDLIDVEIKMNDLSKRLSNLSIKDKELVVEKDFVMFKVPGAATFFIEEGKNVTVSPMKEYDEDLIRLYILGSCMGVVLMQRKIYPLHGSAVVINGKAFAIVGDSGAGKSTLALAFLSQGYQLLSDDIIAVTLSKDGNIPYVTPAYPQQKLWQESLNEFGVESNQFRSIHGRETKFCIPVTSQFYAAPIPLGGIFELITNEESKVSICRIENLETFHTLYRHTYRNFLINSLGLMDWHFSTSASILKMTEVFQLTRPVTGFSAPELVTTILNTLNKGE